MREVILTVGPQAAGKSVFCEKALAFDPSLTLISRDKLLVEMFGTTFLSAYEGGHWFAAKKLWESVGEHLQRVEHLRLILDTWNGEPDERANIIKRLRNFGAERITAWYFETPVEQVDEWFWKKPGIAKTSEMCTRQDEGLVFYDKDAPRKDHKLFHEFAANIDQDGFDKVIRINPLTMSPQQVLEPQTSLNL